MAEPVVDSDKYVPDGASPSQQAIYERPKGFYGLYSHPVTQVGQIPFKLFSLFIHDRSR